MLGELKSQLEAAQAARDGPDSPSRPPGPQGGAAPRSATGGEPQAGTGGTASEGAAAPVSAAAPPFDLGGDGARLWALQRLLFTSLEVGIPPRGGRFSGRGEYIPPPLPPRRCPSKFINPRTVTIQAR